MHPHVHQSLVQAGSQSSSMLGCVQLPDCSRGRVTSFSLCSTAVSCYLGLRKLGSRRWTIMQMEMEG